MAEHQLKGLCYNCDEKYFLGHKCKEQFFFMTILEDVVEEEVVVPPIEEIPLPDATTEPTDPLEVDPLIIVNIMVAAGGIYLHV
jgi:hypothetical protein